MAVFRLERGEPALAFGRWNFGPGDDEALVEGRAADRGQGLLRYLDAGSNAERATRGQTTSGVDGGMGYLEFRPAGGWTRCRAGPRRGRGARSAPCCWRP